jgi:PmbA protein
MSQSTDQIIDTVLDLVSQQNAEGDVLIASEAQLGLKCSGNQLSEYKVTSSQSVGVRVVVGDQIGTSYSESTEHSDLVNMVTSAVENAGYSKLNPHEKIRAHQQTIVDWSSEIYKSDDTDQQKKIDLALLLESGLQGREITAKAPYNGFNEVDYAQTFGNTLGHRCTHRERSFSCYTYALLEQNDKQSMHLGYQVGRTFGELSAQACITEAYETAKALLDGAPVESGQYDIVFNTESLNQVFSAFGMCWSGVSAMKGLNPYRTQLGDIIAHSEFSLTDVPHVPGGFAIKSFDGEGFASQETTIVENGRLSTLLHNSVTAGHFDVPNTANGSRGTKSALSVASSHLCIGAGKESVSGTQSGTYLELISLQGVHSGANAVSGNFSLGASGFLCREGKRVQAVRGITVAGNFYTMLKDIVAISDQIEPDHGRTFFAPHIRFGGLNIAGA